MEGLLERKAARRERMWLNVCWGERWDLKGALHQSKMRIKTQAGGSVRHGQKSRARHGARTKTAWDKWIKAAPGSRRNQVWKQQWFLIYWRWIWGGWFCLKHHDCVVWSSALHWHEKTETNIDKVIKVTDGTKSIFLFILFDSYKLNSLEEVWGRRPLGSLLYRVPRLCVILE